MVFRSLLVVILGAGAWAQSGPLRVLKSNPRYFTDGSGKAIYLAGSHNWDLDNNVNGIDGEALGYYTVQNTAMGRRILALQEAYMRKLIDTVNDLDNVLYEACNESGPFSTAWQHHIVRYVKKYEWTKPKQHPVG